VLLRLLLPLYSELSRGTASAGTDDAAAAAAAAQLLVHAMYPIKL